MHVFHSEPTDGVESDEVMLTTRGETWMEVADSFLRYLLACGFEVTSDALSDHFAEFRTHDVDAEEIGMDVIR